MNEEKTSQTKDFWKPSWRYGVEYQGMTRFFRTMQETREFARSGRAGNPAKARLFKQMGSFQRNYVGRSE